LALVYPIADDQHAIDKACIKGSAPTATRFFKTASSCFAGKVCQSVADKSGEAGALPVSPRYQLFL